METIKDYGIACLRDEAEAILNLIPQLDENFEKAVHLILNSQGRTVITGVGKSGHIGAKIAATLASTGTPSFFVNPLDAYHGDLGMFSPDDVAIAISYSGNTDELLRLLPILLKRDIPIIGISGNPASLLAQYSTCHINVNVKREACPLNLAPTSSTTATLALGDALACALMRMRNFKEEEFAQFHPGGSLGRRLLSRARDVMRTDRLPIVALDDRICDTMIRISDAKLGMAVVTDDDNVVVGIVTDGDIRRAMQNHQTEFFGLRVADIANRNPKTIHQDAKLTEAEQLIFEYKLHSLIVIDSTRRLVGIIDSINCGFFGKMPL